MMITNRFSECLHLIVCFSNLEIAATHIVLVVVEYSVRLQVSFFTHDFVAILKVFLKIKDIHEKRGPKSRESKKLSFLFGI